MPTLKTFLPDIRMFLSMLQISINRAWWCRCRLNNNNKLLPVIIQKTTTRRTTAELLSPAAGPFSTYLRVSGALVGFLETSSFLVDKLLQLLLGKVIQFHGEREGLLCYRLQKKHIVKSNFLKNSVLRSAVYQSSCRPSSAAQIRKAILHQTCC